MQSKVFQGKSPFVLSLVIPKARGELLKTPHPGTVVLKNRDQNKKKLGNNPHLPDGKR